MSSQIAQSTVLKLGIFLIFGVFSAGVYAQDSDADGVPDSNDNCSQAANPNQQDTDGDGFGNLCDPDLNNDNVVNFFDVSAFIDVFLSTDANADFNSDGAVNFADYFILIPFFLQPPGPGSVIPPVTWTDDVSPIFQDKCSPCHTGLGLGGHNIAINYADALLPAGSPQCTELNIGQCTIVRIQNGSMPAGRGCTGDPVLDAGNPSCLTAGEQAVVQSWIDAGLPE